MIEKVNPCHPDKVADRIAGAIVDLAYSKVENPKIAVEVLLGHGVANLIIESSVEITQQEVEAIVSRITGRGDWTGGTDVDAGATNRKLGSDMAQSVSDGGLQGKDLSKADVSVNIYAFLKAQETGKPVELFCAIGDTEIDGKPYAEIVDIARKYIQGIGGFEKFAEWGWF